MNRLSVTAVLIGSLLAVGSADGSERARQAEPDAQARTNTLPAVPTRAARLRGLPPRLDFRATTLEGRPFTGANLAERPVVFWFWAPWCATCVAQGPEVASVARRYSDRVVFVGVAGLDQSEGRLRQFVSRTGTGGITQLDDRAGTLYDRFQVTAPSSLLFMTRSGEVRRVTGPADPAELDGRVRTLAGG